MKNIIAGSLSTEIVEPIKKTIVRSKEPRYECFLRLLYTKSVKACLWS